MISNDRLGNTPSPKMVVDIMNKEKTDVDPNGTFIDSTYGQALVDAEARNGKKRFENLSVFTTTRAHYRSFSGTDYVATIYWKMGNPIILDSLQTISYSTFRQKMPVNVLGQQRTVGYTDGYLTVAGSMIFTALDRNPLIDAFVKSQLGIADSYLSVVEEADNRYNSYSNNQDMELRPDSLPPFDILLVGMNEYGESADIRFYNCRIQEEGQTMSIEDKITENTYTYIAEDVRVMRPNILESRVTYG
jgi:hypothetical protein